MTSRPRQFDLIVFDWDGTLFDSTALIVRSIQNACVDLGLTPPDDERASHVIGLGLHAALEHAVPGLSASRYPELGVRYRHHYFKLQHELSLFPGVLPMLAALKARNHWLAVATGKSRHGLDEALAHTALQGAFDDSRTADETAGKPDPLMLLQLMTAFGATAARTLMIGDTSHDLQMARHAGVSAVAVAYGAHPVERFAGLAPLAVLPSTQALADWLAEHA